MIIRQATHDEVLSLPHFDHTKLSAINTCPTWGIIRYGHHKTMPGFGRAMALEAGKTMHECFSAIRLMALSREQDLPEHAAYVGRKLFGDRYDAIITDSFTDTWEDSARNAALSCLETSGYQDDMFDKRRTYVNLETAILFYTMQYPVRRYPVWVADRNDPTALVGIEIPFALHIDFENEHTPPCIYTGRVDGLHTNGTDVTDLLIQENKTASRLDDAWRMSFEMAHQVTGYTIAASVVSNHLVERALVMGLSLPLPRDTGKGYTTTHVTRKQFMRDSWELWLWHTVNTYNVYYSRPTDAPMYTHACNRYFRPCAFIPLCATDPQDRKHIFEHDMVKDEWTPLDEVIGD